MVTAELLELLISMLNVLGLGLVSGLNDTPGQRGSPGTLGVFVGINGLRVGVEVRVGLGVFVDVLVGLGVGVIVLEGVTLGHTNAV